MLTAFRLLTDAATFTLAGAASHDGPGGGHERRLLNVLDRDDLRRDRGLAVLVEHDVRGVALEGVTHERRRGGAVGSVGILTDRPQVRAPRDALRGRRRRS